MLRDTLIIVHESRKEIDLYHEVTIFISLGTKWGQKVTKNINKDKKDK
jgi:hypothetical protein